MQLNAVNPNGGSPLPDVSVGVATFDGNGNISQHRWIAGLLHRREQWRYESSRTALAQRLPPQPTTSIRPARPTYLRVRPGHRERARDRQSRLVSGEHQPGICGGNRSLGDGGFVPASSRAGDHSPSASFLGSYLGSTTDPVLASVTNEVDVALTPPPGGILQPEIRNQRTGRTSGRTEPHRVLRLQWNWSGTTMCSAEGAAFGKI